MNWIYQTYPSMHLKHYLFYLSLNNGLNNSNEIYFTNYVSLVKHYNHDYLYLIY